MKTSFSFLLFFLCLWPAVNVFGYTEKNLLQNKANPQQVAAALQLNQTWVKYPGYADRAAWDLFLGDSKAEYIAEGVKNLSYEWQVVKATDYLEFERSGNRQIMEKPINSNLIAIYSLFMAELAEGKGRFIDQLINGVYNMCEITSWSLSAHLGGQQTARHLPDHREHYIDLMAGDVGAMLSWIHYFFHPSFDQVDPVIAERMRYELKRRIMEPYLTRDHFWWLAANYRPGMMVNNWNPWCNASVLQTFLLMENDRDILAKAVYRSMVSVDKFINYTHDDGACEEGPAYWENAAGKMYDYLQILSDATRAEVDIFDHPLMKNMGEYIVHSYIGDGWVVNFADASAKGGGDLSLIYRYGKAVKSEAMLQHATSGVVTTKRKSALARSDIYRGFQTLAYAKEMEAVENVAIAKAPFTWYPQTEFCYMTNADGFFFAAKGGFNDESHNHNDIGSFVVYIDNTPVFIDAGVGTYTRQTFSNERYSIWTMQSNYHNLPMINGVPQAYGQNYKATDVAFNSRAKKFSANIATAYPEQAKVKTWMRSYTLKKSALLIEDQFELKAAEAPNQVNFLTWGVVDISRPGEVLITIEGKKVSLTYDKAIFTPSVEAIPLDDPRLSSVWGKEVYRLSLNTEKMPKAGGYKFQVKRAK